LWLDLAANQITNIMPLAFLTRLQELYQAYNTISSVSPLAGLKQLSVLDFSGNRTGNGREMGDSSPFI